MKRWKGLRAVWNDVLESEVHGPSVCTSALLPVCLCFRDMDCFLLWFSVLGGTRRWASHCSLLWPEGQKKGVGRKASFLQGLLLPAPQCRHRSEVGLGGIQPCVSCTFKAAFEGMKSSRFFHFRESACEKGGGGEKTRRGCPGPTKLLLPSSWAVALCKPISQKPLHLIPTGQSHHSLRISGERTQVPVLGPSVQGASFLGKHSL